VFGAGFLEHPSALPLAGVYVFFGILGENGFALVDLTRCFVLLCPVDDPVFEAGRVVVVVGVADGGFCGFGCGLGNVLAQTDYGLELYRVWRQAESVWAKRDATIQEHGDVWGFDEGAHGADAEAL